MSLVQVVEKFQEVNDEQRQKLENIYRDLKEDTQSAIAATIVQSVERDEIENKKDLYDLMESLKAYKTKEVDNFLNIEYEYNFEPPGDEFPVEYSDLLEKPRLLVLKDDGTRMEVDEEGNEIGPLDFNDRPAEGHPEYITLKLPKTNIGLESSLEIKNDYDVSDKELEEFLSDAFNARIYKEQLSKENKNFPSAVKKELPLEEVFLDTAIGRLLFEPEKVIQSTRSFVMVFDTSRSKPPIYPRLGSTFRLEYKDQDLPVSYMETTFEYQSKKFMIFIVLDEDE